MEFIFYIEINIKVGIMVLGDGQTCPKYPKQEIGNIFAMY